MNRPVPRPRRALGLVAAAVASLALAAPARAATLEVCDDPGKCDFSRIQAAVNAAAEDDTIRVRPGRYQETVRVAKRLDFEGPQLGRDARGRGDPDRDSREARVGAQNGGFVLEANGISIDGFTILGAGRSGGPSEFDAGVAIPGTVSGVRIANNVIRDNVFGLQLNNIGADPDRAVVRRNLFLNNNNDGGEGDEQGNGIFSDHGASNSLIERNQFTGHQNEAMLLRDDGAVASGIDIRDNRLIRDSAIVLIDARAVRVIENTSEANVDDDVIDDDVVRMAGNVDGALIRANKLRRYEGAGIAISNESGAGVNRNVTVVGNSLVGNADVTTDRGVRLRGGAYAGRLPVHFNRIAGNQIGVANEDPDPAQEIDAKNNWWGSNARPGTPPSDGVAGNVDVGPRLQLRLFSKRSVKARGHQLKVRASLQFNSADPPPGGERFNPSPFPDGTTIRFDTDRGRIEKKARTINGQATAIFVSGRDTGRARITAELDFEEVTRRVRVR